MDDHEDGEKLVKFTRSLFPGDVQLDAETEVFLESEASVYLLEILQSDVEKLQLEQSRLDDVAKELHENKAALVLENYSLLLDASAQLENVTKSLPEIKNQLQTVLTQLSATDLLSREFEQRISDFTTQRAHSQELLGQIGQVQDIFEIPVLMDNLAKNGLFDEAVDLIQFMEKLVHQLPGSITASCIAEQVRKRGWMIMNILANQLRTTSVQLLQALKIVSLERRLGQTLNIAVEEYVRMDFLQARSTFINSLIRGISQRDSFQFSAKVVEISRLHFFDTMNHYLSVFPDSTELSADLRILPFIWLQKELAGLLALLTGALPQIEDNRLESLFNQLNSLSEALSRFGSNISCNILDMFVAHVFSGFQKALQDGLHEFRAKVLSGISFKNRHTVRTSNPPEDENAIRPPELLLDFTALAELCNRVLAAFSRLRFCFIANLVVPVIFAVNCFLAEAVTAVNTLRSDNKLEQEFKDIFQKVFIPFIDKSIDAICPPQDAAALLGITLQECKLILSNKNEHPKVENNVDDHLISNGFSEIVE